MKLSQIKRRYTYCKENPVFSTRAMWDLIKTLENNPYEAYWDYGSELSKDDIDAIEQKGWQGLYEVEENLHDLNWEYIEDGKAEIRIENIPEFLSDYKLSFLVSVLREHRELDPEARADDVISLGYNELCDLSSDFEEVVQDLKDFQSYDLKIEDLFSNTTYEKALWYEILGRNVEDYFPNIIKEMEKQGYEYQEYKKDLYIKVSYPQDTIEDVTSFFSNYNRAYANIKTSFNVTLCFENEDGEEIEKECSLELDLYADDFSPKDEDEYQDNEWNEVIEMDISEVDFWYPSDADLDQWQVMFNNVPNIGKSDVNMAEVHFVLDGKIYIVEAERAAFAGRGGLYSFKTFGFNREANLWEENTVRLIDNLIKPENVVFINSEGKVGICPF